MKIMVEAEMKYETVNRKIDVDPNNMGIAMILDKCTNCGKCKTTCENIVGIHYDGAKSLAPVCIECGQCILNCPVGALVPKYNYQKVFKLIDDPEKVVIAFTAPGCSRRIRRRIRYASWYFRRRKDGGSTS